MSDPHHGLDWTVQCKWPHNAFFETIAAFNDGTVAAAYAKDCRESHPELFVYRVIAKQEDGSWR